MKRLVGFILTLTAIAANAQVDTSYIYNTTTPYGTLDLRLAKSATRYYYLQENITQSFRESSPGVKTNTYYDRTSWDSSPYSQGNMKERNGNNNLFIMNYRLLFPQGYNASYTEGYPMIVMMHGAGERANCWDNSCYWDDRGWNPNANNPPAPTSPNHSLLNNDHNLTHGGLPHLTARNLAGTKLPNDPTLHPRAFPGFVLFAQNLNGWDKTTTSDCIRLIRLLIKKYNIDPNRIYVHGLSNGGAAVYEVTKRAPWLFAAALPMSAISDASVFKNGLIPKIAHIPHWTFQGGQDTSPNPTKTQGFVRNLQNAGGEVRYSLYPNLGHGTWNTAYAEPDFFTWMLSKSKTKLHVFFNNPAICGTNGVGVKMGFAAGFLAYQWEKDGSIINGANGPEYIANEPGVYRARFSRKSTNPTEAQWNGWSQTVNVVVSNPEKPVIQTLTSTALRGPDNAAQNTVRLRAQQGADRYFWYKNGLLVNIPQTSLDDTTRHYTITTTSATSGNGAYTLLTRTISDCPSPLSDPVNLYFGNSAPLLPDSNIPGNFQGTALSGGTISLSWTDNSSEEIFFEVWRRKLGGTFVLAGKVPANQTSFVDINLEPNSQYHYKVRTVNNAGRSKYAPADAVATNLIVTTLGDFANPTAPGNLDFASNTINSISLTWDASTDDNGIRRYRVTYGSNTAFTTAAQTSLMIGGLPANTAYNITVAAEDLAGNYSSESSSVQGSTYVTGLTYGHSTGAWTDLDLITNWNTPEFTGTVSEFTLAPRTQEDFFNFEFKGYIYIATGGTYQFRTISDDGSRVALNNVTIVNNDGVHGTETVVTSSNQSLVTGAYPINVKYFEYTGDQALNVYYRGPDTGGAWVIIPATALKSGSVPPVPGATGEPVFGGGRMAASAETLAEPEFMLYVFPNPSSSDNINIRVDSGIDAPVNVKLIDMVGRAHYDNTFTREEAAQGAKVQPNAVLINGIYVLMVRQGNKLIKEKIVVKN